MLSVIEARSASKRYTMQPVWAAAASYHNRSLLSAAATSVSRVVRVRKEVHGPGPEPEHPAPVPGTDN